MTGSQKNMLGWRTHESVKDHKLLSPFLSDLLCKIFFGRLFGDFDTRKYFITFHIFFSIQTVYSAFLNCMTDYHVTVFFPCYPDYSMPLVYWPLSTRTTLSGLLWAFDFLGCCVPLWVCYLCSCQEVAGFKSLGQQNNHVTAEPLSKAFNSSHSRDTWCYWLYVALEASAK